MTASVSAIFLVVILYTEAQAIALPQEWKDLLKVLGEENEKKPCSPPIVRDIATFSSVAAMLAENKVNLNSLYYSYIGSVRLESATVFSG